MPLRDTPREDLFPRESGEEARAAGTPKKSLPKAYLEGILAGLKAGVAIVSVTGDILYANQRFAELLSIFPVSGIERKKLNHYISAGSWEALETGLKRAMQAPTQGQMRIAAGDHVSTLNIQMLPLRCGSQIEVGVIAEEVTELIKANEDLRVSQESIHSLTARILQVQDQEQRRVARNLHDITGQDLTALALCLSHVAQGENPDAESDVPNCLALVHKIQDDIRTLSYLLHPPLLDEMGLLSALRIYLDGLRKRGTLDVDLESPANLPRFSEQVETGLFRVLQESLSNVLRHSGCNKAKIRISMDGGTLRISVSDSGRGLPPAKNDDASSGVGIPGMKERMRLLGGHLELRSKLRGAEVIGTIPAAALAGTTPDLASPVAAQAAAQEVPPGPDTKPTGAGRILIVDDHDVTRQGIKTLLSHAQDLELCGEAADGLEAIAKTEELHPDLVILDLSLPRVGGITAARKILEIKPDVKILIFTTHQYPGLERMIKAAGCHGFVAKANASHDLIRGARAVLSGHEFYGLEMARANSA